MYSSYLQALNLCDQRNYLADVVGIIKYIYLHISISNHGHTFEIHRIKHLLLIYYLNYIKNCNGIMWGGLYFKDT